MFLSSPSVLLFIRRYGFEMYSLQNPTPTVFTFPDTAIRNLETIDKTQLREALEAFFKEQPLTNQQIIILLSEDILFHTVLPNEVSEQQQVEKRFLDEVPIDPMHRAHTNCLLGDQLHCFAVNKQLYSTLNTLLEDQKNQVLAVLPAYIFGQVENSQAIFGQQSGFISEALPTVFKMYHQFKATNFIVPEKIKTSAPTGHPEEETENPSPSLKLTIGDKKQTIVALIAFAVFFAVVISGVLFFLRQQAAEVKKVNQARVPQQEEIVSSPPARLTPSLAPILPSSQ